MIRLAFVSIFLSCLLITAQPSLAKEKASAPSVSPWLYKKLTMAEKLISRKAYNKARVHLEKIHSKVDKGSFEEATVLRSLASVYALQEHYKKAAQALEKVVKLKVLPEKQEQQALQNLGQLYMATEQYRKAVTILEPWLAKNPQADAEINILLANAYAQLKQYRKALPYVQNAIKRSKKPAESWYQLNLAIYYELNQYKPASALLEKMMRYFPDKKTYWNQAVAVYQQRHQYQRAAAIKKLAYLKGYLTTEKEIIQLADLLSYIGAPYQSARLLQKEIEKGRVKRNSEHWELLADTWTQAREYDHALVALNKASSLNPKGKLYHELARLYVEKEQWGKALDALNNAVAKGGLNRPGDAYLLQGMCHHEMKQDQQARMAFLKAKKYSHSRKAANQWLNFISKDKTLHYS